MKAFARRLDRTNGNVAALIVCLMGIAILWPAIARAQPVVSQVIEATAPIYDQRGSLLPGNEPARETLGKHYIRGCMAQILVATTGVIRPPLTDGAPHPDNSVIHTTYIGHGIDPEIMWPGRFATMVTPRPANGAKIFVRVFNQPSLELVSFYADSQLFTVSWSADTTFYADIPHTANAIDPADDDGDGLNNSWERVNGSNPNLADTDEDEFDDMQEFLAGTDADDWDSFLRIIGMKIENEMIKLQYAAGKNRAVRFQQTAEIGAHFGNCPEPPMIPSGVTTPGDIIELPLNSEENVQIFRFGVMIDAL
jgi:hypothetical protein